MRRWRALGLAFVTLLGLTGVVLGITVALLDPTASDLIAMAAFLLVSGGVTIGLVITGEHFGLPRSFRSLRTKMAMVAVLTALLSLANVGFVALLMFLSTHDLALLAALLTFALGMAFFLALAFSESTTQSLGDLVKAAKRMSEGRLDTRVAVSDRDEAGELAAAFNSMAQRLEATFAKQRELEQARRDLITAVSHDLRTPLASVRAMVESINDGVVSDPETMRRYLRTTQSEVERLGQLMDDLFELSQMDAGHLQLHVEEASLSEVVAETLDGMAPQAVASRVKLQGSIDSTLPPVVMDPRRVQRVLYNLVQNAIRHTPPDGTIWIRTVEAENEVKVEVSDNGEGIPEQELLRLFERTYRPDPSRSRRSGGAGLGLSIAKGIVEAHGGRIWVESKVGRGSTFYFTLPKAGSATR
jgi:signal transduction histidine kinase